MKIRTRKKQLSKTRNFSARFAKDTLRARAGKLTRYKFNNEDRTWCEADYKHALSEIDSLMMAKLGTPEGARLDMLARKVEVYERKFKL